MMHGTLVYDNGHLAVKAVTGHVFGEPVAEVHTFRGAYIGSFSDYCSLHPEQEKQFGMKLITFSKPFQVGHADWQPLESEGYSSRKFWTFLRPFRDDPEHEIIPCPKVRAGVQVRWHHNGYWGSWEKLLKKGWVSA